MNRLTFVNFLDNQIKFNENLLSEGLIRSWDNETFSKKLENILKDYPGLDYYVDYEDEDRSVLLNIENIKDVFKTKNDRKIFYDKLEKLNNQSGFFILNKNLSLQEFIDYLFTTITIEFSKKYNIETGVPEYLYHVTHPRYIKNILQKGLVPKSKKMMEDHPERIYLTDRLLYAKRFAGVKYRYTANKDFKDYIILKIDTKKLNNIKLYLDPLRGDFSNMYYTLDNIPPWSFEIIKEDTLNEYNRNLKINNIIKKFDKFDK